MAEWMKPRGTRAERMLWWAAVFYAVAFLLHTGDHLRRGLGVETGQVLVLGSASAVLQVFAIGAVFARHRLAAVLAAATGFPDAVGITAVHMLPQWSSFSDAFPGAHGTGVTAFSWFAAGAEIVGALLFGLAGVYVVRSRRGDLRTDGLTVRSPGLA